MSILGKMLSSQIPAPVIGQPFLYSSAAAREAPESSCSGVRAGLKLKFATQLLPAEAPSALLDVGPIEPGDEVASDEWPVAFSSQKVAPPRGGKHAGHVVMKPVV